MLRLRFEDNLLASRRNQKEWISVRKWSRFYSCSFKFSVRKTKEPAMPFQPRRVVPTARWAKWFTGGFTSFPWKPNYGPSSEIVQLLACFYYRRLWRQSIWFWKRSWTDDGEEDGRRIGCFIPVPKSATQGGTPKNFIIRWQFWWEFRGWKQLASRAVCRPLLYFAFA